MSMPAYVPEEERFWARVDRRGPDDCWPWTGKLDKGGYGSFRLYRGRVVNAHRYALLGPQAAEPAALPVDHNCHNLDVGCPGGDGDPHRACCNPAHLREVEPIQNAWDGRNFLGATCAQGHERRMMPSGRFYCPTCTAEYQKAYRARQLVSDSGDC